MLQKVFSECLSRSATLCAMAHQWLNSARRRSDALGAVIVHNAGRVALLVQAVVLVGAAIDLQPGVQVLVDRGERVARAGPFEVAAALPRHVLVGRAVVDQDGDRPLRRAGRREPAADR